MTLEEFAKIVIEGRDSDRNKNGGQMTEEQLKEIEGRANAATPGPWTLSWSSTQCSHEDSKLIAHAREDIPNLIAEIRRLQSLINGVPSNP